MHIVLLPTDCMVMEIIRSGHRLAPPATIYQPDNTESNEGDTSVNQDRSWYFVCLSCILILSPFYMYRLVHWLRCVPAMACKEMSNIFQDEYLIRIVSFISINSERLADEISNRRFYSSVLFFVHSTQ